MTADEHAIYELTARYAGHFVFLVQEATNILYAIDPARLQAILDDV